MGLFGKKDKSANQPAEKRKRFRKPAPKKEEYTPVPSLIGNGEDYHIYEMSLMDQVKGYLIGFAGGAVVAYVFFEIPVFVLIGGLIAMLAIRKPWKEYLHKKRLRTLLLQFKDFLDALASSYSAGLTTTLAFQSAYTEMGQLYGEDSDIAKELYLILAGLQHNFTIEQLLQNFADRSGLDDVESFAGVFEVCNRMGGNLQQIVSETRGIISDKIDMEMEIQTLVAAGKNDLNIMMVMPLFIMLSLRGLNTTTSGGAIYFLAKCAVLSLFGLSYWIGLKITDIKL